MIQSAAFITSYAAATCDFPKELPEICMVGRSNVGKSSLINGLCRQKGLARVSNTPGRTRLLNLFEVSATEGAFYLVDLPGYGYQAGGSRIEAAAWQALADGYLNATTRLKVAVHIVDIRHPPAALDVNLERYLYHMRVPFMVVASKADKIARSKIPQQLSVLDGCLGIGVANIIPYSAETGYNLPLIAQTVLSRVYPPV
ncbi:MAG: ribosome biogenesis GTP-binding protein YihA/YsxC [Clostridiales bacterium]|jgi:GTP-binding protein|nr:ribosome biogenesis GTP-binding protein YihA/YsxC [Clostridiales bacterium]